MAKRLVAKKARKPKSQVKPQRKRKKIIRTKKTTTRRTKKHITIKRSVKKHAIKRVSKKTARPTKRVVKKHSTRRIAKRVTKKRTTKRVVKKSSRRVAKKHNAKKHIMRKRRAPTRRAPLKKRATTKTSVRTSALERVLIAERATLRPSLKPIPDVYNFFRELERKIPSAQVVPGGSYAKGTFLKGSHDIDVFIRFPRETPDHVMSAAIANAVPQATVLHGSRDYFQVTHAGFVFELVPVCSVTSPDQIRNVTDMSPLHVAYVTHTLSPTQKDDARLAKQFCKAAGIYGAESYIKGFSGYTLEILIGYYGSFEKLLRAAATQWLHAHGSKVVIDPAQHYTDAHSALLRMNEAKTAHAPLVLIDPIDPERNAAAALSKESYACFRECAQAFLTKPSAAFFDTTLSRQRILHTWNGKTVFFVTTATPDERQDIAGCQVLAQHERAIAILTDTGFPLVHAEWRFGVTESTCWYVLAKTTLAAETEQRGPPAEMTDAVAIFREKHARAFLRQSRWYAPVKREYTRAEDAIRSAWRETSYTLSKH